jgi:hypothetical protein
MSIFDWVLFVGFLSFVVAVSIRGGVLVDYVWFQWVNPAMEHMQKVAEEFEKQNK